ncbi:MAG: NAD(P)-dependent glycerol-3-phosphate dehydrogenase [Alphaproteobacteria bacterium]|nr:NAD(P)-dependent glycerol-3-phosphate dehydrogenase [Alphaproteobacteria bacterium]
MTKVIDNITVIGAGAWGTALAQVAATAGRNVTLYARSAHLADHINTHRKNLLYLPSVTLRDDLHATHDMAAAVESAGMVLLVTPAQHMRETLVKLLPLLPKGIPLINAAKGIEIKTGKLLSETAAEIAPDHPFAILSGPTFADETAKGLPTAITLATTANEDSARIWAESLHNKTFRPYLSADVTGAEIGGAVKNVIAIACGIVEGRGLGQNARAAVMTRGMAEIKRLGLAKGAKADTFIGLSGLGDLTLTCNSTSSRNFSLGFELGQGKTLADIMAKRNSVAEGVTTARAIATHADALGVDMPICLAIDHILHGGGNIDEVITGLLSRAIRQEDA